LGELYGELGQALGYLADPAYWIVLFIAVFVAGFTGMVPGASGVIIMAISIPFIVEFFGRDRGGPNDMRAIGLVALASMTGVNNTLDSIPAILFGQPSAATQVTFLEGHQLARQGRAAHTLGAVYAVSAMGGIIGATVLALLIPVAKPIILKFSFPEIAAVAFFGIVMVAALSAGAMARGLAAGALGVLLGTVGINPITGDVRYVFDQPNLWEGLPIVVVTIGFFALPEMIDLAIARRPVAPPDSVVNTREVWRGAKHGFTRWPMVIRQSVFGVILGAIPGVGAAVIDWLSYAFGIFWTKDKSQFGKGSLDGVLFAESAQNSKEAGQALPTLTLGVPGGLAWVLVYVAMQALDMTPGPRLLGDQADVMILFVLTLGIGNLIVTSIGIVATGQLAKLTRIPYPLIGGIFIPIVILSTVMNWTSWLALPVAAVFMGIGIIMKLFQWPRPPLLLGIILGPIIEENFLSALNVVDPFTIGGFESEVLGVLLRPLTIALIVIAFATAYFFSRAAQSRGLTTTTQAPAGGSGTGPDDRAGILRRLVEVRNVPIFLAIAGSIAFYWGSLGFMSVESWFLTRLMVVFVIILSLVQLFFHLRERGHRHVDIMDLGMHSLALPGAKQAIWILATGFLMFAMLTGTIGLRWAVIAFAGYVPFTLLAGNSLPLARGILVGVVTGALSGIAASLIGITGASETFAADTDAVADTGRIIATSATVAVAMTVAVSVNARGVGGMPGLPGVMGVVALTFIVTVCIAAGMTRGGFAEVPLLAALGVLTLGLLFIRSIREYQPPPSLQGFFAWRILGPIITMCFVFLFIYGMADNVLSIIWPQPALLEWIGREILGTGA
jgi:TctA family transporter